MSRTRISPSALLVGVVYAPLAWMWSPIFPFCAVPMYADIAGYHESHVPVFFAEGEPGDPADYVDFTAVAADDIVLPGPASLGFVTERHAWHVRTHPWDGAGAEPDVHVAFGWRRLEVTPEGVRRGPVQVVAAGRARPR